MEVTISDIILEITGLPERSR